MLLSFRGRTLREISREMFRLNNTISDLEKQLSLKMYEKENLISELNSFSTVKSEGDHSHFIRSGAEDEIPVMNSHKSYKSRKDSVPEPKDYEWFEISPKHNSNIRKK